MKKKKASAPPRKSLKATVKKITKSDLEKVVGGGKTRLVIM